MSLSATRARPQTCQHTQAYVSIRQHTFVSSRSMSLSAARARPQNLLSKQIVFVLFEGRPKLIGDHRMFVVCLRPCSSMSEALQ